MRYRLEELAKIASEIGLSSRWVDSDRLDVLVHEGCVLSFCNLRKEDDTLVGFDGTPWHSHGTVQFSTGDSIYVEYDELEILIGLGAGELVVVSEYVEGQLRDRWIAHRQEPFELRHMRAGDELRVYRLPEPNASG